MNPFTIPILLLLIFLNNSCELLEPEANHSDSKSDTIPPALKLIGEKLDTAFLFTHYTDPGATLLDEKAGDLFVYKEGRVKTQGEVNTRLPGEYQITYSASDAAGNLALPITRTVIVTENSSNFLNGHYSVSCTCTLLPQGSSTPSLTASTYTAFVNAGSERNGFEISRLNLGPVTVLPKATLNGHDITISYYDRDLNYTDGSEEVYKNTLSVSKTSFTIETKVMPWSPLVTYHCKNVYTKNLRVSGLGSQ